MTLDADLGIKDFDKAISLWNVQEPIEPLAELSERVNACRGVILSSDHAKIGAIFFTGVIVGDLIGVVLSELTAPQKIHSLAPIWFAVAAFFAAASLSFYRICVVYDCCKKKTDAF